MFNLANILTAGNLVCGIVAILLAISGCVMYSPFVILIGAILDFLDGFVARLMHKTSELGKQLDSLADMVTFGVAPGIIMMTVLIMDGKDLSPYVPMEGNYVVDWIRDVVSINNDSWLPLVAFLIPFFALFRLAKFNIDSNQSSSFIGLPTPALTLFFMSYPLSLWFYNEGESSRLYETVFNDYFIVVVVIAMSLMMVSRIPLFSLKFKTFGFPGNEFRYVFLLISLGLIVFFHVWSLALIVFLYLILSLIENTTIKQKSNEI